VVVAKVEVEVEEVGEGEGEEVGLLRKTPPKSRSSLLLPAVKSTSSTNGCTLLMAPTMAHPLACPTPSTLMACTHV